MADNEVVTDGSFTEATPEQRAQSSAAAKAELEAAIKEQQAQRQPEPAPQQVVDNSQAQVARDPETGRFAPQAQADVPVKFQKPDGSLDEGRLDKALTSLEKLAKYKTLESDFHKGRQAQAQPEPVNPNGYAPPAPQFSPAQLQAQQVQTPEMQAWLQMYSVADYAAAQRASALESQIKEMKRDQRLGQLAETDPDFLRADVADEIGKLFVEKPHLWNTPDPYGEALLMAKGRLGDRLRSGQASPKQSPAATLPGGSTSVGSPATVGASPNANAVEGFKKFTLEQQRAILFKTPTPR